MIKLYQFEMSPFCTKIALILNAKEVPYQIIEVPVSKSYTVKNYSATSKLPAIEHNGKFIDDSTDIAYYLDGVFPDRPLIPVDEKLWVKCHLYEDWADESLNFYMMKLRWLPHNQDRWSNELAKFDSGLWRWLVTKFASRAALNILDKQGVGRKSEQAALRDIDRHMRALTIDLQESRFLVEDELSLADISVYAQLKWISENPQGKAVIDAHQNIIQWMERVDFATRKNV